MKILLVEDNPLDVDLTRRELKRAFSDLHLVVTTNIEDAWVTLQAGTEFDIVLTDLRLPAGGSGLDLVRKIRFADLSCAVVALTGQGDEATAVSAIKLGADDYVAKRHGYHRRLPQIVSAAISRFRQETNRKQGLLRVLYAEHNRADIEQTRKHLARYAPHVQLDIVHTGTDTLAHLPAAAGEPFVYDVLLLDFNLPGENALDMLKLLHDERHLDLPVILIAAQGDEEIAVQALRLGATDYIVKNTGYLHELPVALENAHVRARLAQEQAALKGSEARFRRLAENASDLIYRYAFFPVPHYEYVSPAALPMTGYLPEDHYADPQFFYEIVHPEDRHLLEDVANGQMNNQHPLVLRWRRKDGTIIWTEQRNTPIYNSDGRLIAIEGIVRDITQSRQALETLQQHLGEMRALYRVSSALRTAQTAAETVDILLDQTMAALQTDTGAVWLYDDAHGDLRISSAGGWCRQMARITIRPGEGITGSVFATATARLEDDVALSMSTSQNLRPFIPAGWSGGWAPIRTTDAIVGVLFVAVPAPNNVTSDQLKLVMSLAEMAGSILQRLRLLQQAQAQADLTRQIVNTVPEGLALVNHEGHLLMVNASAEAILRDLGSVINSAIAESIAEYNLEAASSSQVAWREIQHSGRTFILNTQPVERNNPATSWVLMIEDATKEREQQRYQEAQDRLATVGQLAAGIAHDFNNVLGVISVYAEVMQAAPNLSSRQQQQLATVVDQTHHAASLVRQVLDFSRRSVMERTPIDVAILVNEQIKLLKRTLSESIQLHLHSYEKHFQVSADPTRLRQVLMNLAINARDAMPEGGVLTFALSRVKVTGDVAATHLPLPDMAPGDWVRLAVSDTGVGIAPAHLAHIFEPFFTTKPVGQGTGLGLAQVYGIVKQHGGAINVTSTPGHGTTFDIYLPLIDAGPSAAAVTAVAPDRRGSECILLVEDNADLCVAVAQSLETLGYHVLQAFNGTTALHLACQPGVVVDLVLSDMVMPGWNGLDLYAALRKLQPTADLLIMTGHPISPTHTAALQEMSGFWIQKPFVLSELADLVRATLDQARFQPAS